MQVTAPDLSQASAIVNPQNTPGSSHSLSAPSFLDGLTLVRPAGDSPWAGQPLFSATPGTIGRMEAAFFCNDTPFIDQVRFPFTSLWGGRLKLTTIESDVTTANFVLGLPGAGTLRSLSLTGSGHLAVHAPPSDQLVAMHMTFTLRSSQVEPLDNSGLRGVQYLVGASRGFLQSFTPR